MMYRTPHIFSRFLCFLVMAGLAVTSPARAEVTDVLKSIQRDGQARVIVRMKSDTGAAAWSTTQSALGQRAAVSAALDNVRPALRSARINTYKTFHTLPLVATTVTQDQLLSLMSTANVESVSLVRRDRQMETAAASSTDAQLLASVSAIGVSDAWAKGYDGTGYAVAVIDGGFNLSHPMLQGKAVGDACFGSDYYGTSTCPSGQTQQIGAGAASNCPSDGSLCVHGTFVASLAVGNDGTNFGVARGAKLVPINVFYVDSACSPDPTCTDSEVELTALDYVNEHATDYKIAAVNMSLGGGDYSGYCDDDPRKSIIDMLRQKGIAVAIAAGNDGLTGQISAPACISSSLSVGGKR